MSEQTVKQPFLESEERVRLFWEEAETFKASVEKAAPLGEYTFYDGPPFATGTPHYGHIVSTVIKDVVPRFWTMRGYSVERRWGWDCHGLPIENIVEKELGIVNKRQIEEMGVGKFNELCRSKVLSYVDEWKKAVRQIGRWVDMENDYKTMDLDYMESVWWVFKQLWDKDLIYEGYRSMHVCPRCETTLAQAEVSENYKDVKDLSVVVKFELVDEEKTHLLAWTTTPWTLPGNVALAVKTDLDYLKVKVLNLKKKEESGVIEYDYYIIAKDIYNSLLLKDNQDSFKSAFNLTYADDKNEDGSAVEFFSVIEEFKGSVLVGKKYKPLFADYALRDDLANKDNGWKVYAADFVNNEEGTGIVHIAPGFGEDDLNLSKEFSLPFVQHVGMDGVIKEEIKELAGLHVKPIDNVSETDIEVIKYLAKQGVLFSKVKYEHSYPHCWRCDTPLINYATTSWFVAVSKIKEQALSAAQTINWSPDYIKEGRFGNWLEGARDWSVSRQRFWASVMPIWRSEDKSETMVFGSVKELEEASGQKVTDLHKHEVDKITFLSPSGKLMKRVPDVLDTWFDSGSMPYAYAHYPFADKESFDNNFPAEFIAEGIDQTRTWFYYLHVIATGLFNKAAFKNVIVNGTVLAEDGKKMSKRLQNYPDPIILMNQYGADALRLYLLASPVVLAENLIFFEKGVGEALRKNIMLLWNIYSFYEMYAEENTEANSSSENVLDLWLLARLGETRNNITEAMENYHLPRAVRSLTSLIDDFSTWYLRRSRERFKGEDQEDKKRVLSVTKYALLELSKLLAPFAPFAAEAVWQKVIGFNFQDKAKSVHLEKWPEEIIFSQKILEDMSGVKKIVEGGLAKRDEAKIKIRQPLKSLTVKEAKPSLDQNDPQSGDLINLIKDELNVKEVIFVEGDNEFILDTVINEELQKEGLKRELVRLLNTERKKLGLTIKDKIVVTWFSGDSVLQSIIKEYQAEIAKDTLAEAFKMSEEAQAGEKLKLSDELFVWVILEKI
ncbi:MAG: isoleucine--tRNA ligase [Patescibacteria group bacterium]|nr:MAG: isoleucine--tRNA ligase [Patescibacteria group bacterium]